MKQRSSENVKSVFRRPFYYVPLEQNVGWVANPTFCEIEQFCWVLTQPTLATLAIYTGYGLLVLLFKVNTDY